MIGLRRRRQRRTLFLGALALVLGAVIAVEIGGAAHAPPANVPTTSRPSAPALQSSSPRFVLPPLTRYHEVTARPLFSDTRRPALESAAKGDAQSAAFVLIGIVISPNDRYALIAHGKPLRIERASVGQELDGWTVRSILPDRVVFANGGSNLELKPRDATPPARDTLSRPQRPGEPAR